MILKFCFENEIHRCSDPPRDFASLGSFLTGMFRLPIPSQIDLTYVNPQGQTVSLNTEEDYQALMKINSNKPVKIVITEKKQLTLEEERVPLNEGYGGEGAEYEVIPHYREESPKEKKVYNDIIEISEDSEHKSPLLQEEKIIPDLQDEKRDSLDGMMEDLTQKIAENYIVPQVQAAPQMSATEIKKLVKEALREEMPSIVAQVKEALLRENQARPQHNANIPEQVQPRNNLPISYQAYYSYPYFNNPVNRFNGYPGQIPQPPVHRPEPRRDRVVPEPQPQYNPGIRHAPSQAEMNQDKGPQLFNKVVNALSVPLEKASEMVDNWMQKFEGDPYVQCPEGKYPKSVVDKVAHMREIFPEENRKELLEFVQRFPKDAPLDQIVSVYWSKKGVH